jgi:hypothetical protein
VGADQPVKAVYQAPVRWDVPASSQASQLPQLDVRTDPNSRLDIHPVGAGLPAKAVYQAPVRWDVPASSQASQLPQLDVRTDPNSRLDIHPVGTGLPAKVADQAPMMLNSSHRTQSPRHVRLERNLGVHGRAVGFHQDLDRLAISLATQGHTVVVRTTRHQQQVFGFVRGLEQLFAET